MDLKVGIITISDRPTGPVDDLGGPALKEAAQGYGWELVADALVADEKRDIQRAVLEQLRQGAQLVLTTGECGVAVRDITPEAVREIASRELPGFGEVMRMESIILPMRSYLAAWRRWWRRFGPLLPGKPKGAVNVWVLWWGPFPTA